MVHFCVLIGDSLVFLGFVVFCVYELFVLISLSDLESDLIAAKDFSDQLNPFVLPVYAAHIFVALLALICGKWGQFLFEIPFMLIHYRNYKTSKYRFDFLILRRPEELKKQNKEHAFELVNYLTLFIWSFVGFVLILLLYHMVIS